MVAPSVGVVIPAYNEADNLPPVLDVVCAVPWLARIVVVDDGSPDATLAAAQEFARWDPRLEALRLPQNRGKAAAMLAGVDALDTDVAVFLDADLVGLQPHHLQQLCAPVLAGESDMAVALFRYGHIRTDVAHRLTPVLSGQRCLRRQAARQALTPLVNSGYGVETGMAFHASKEDWRVHYVIWEQLTHVMKEQKRGWTAGVRSRWHMYSQILAVLLLLLAGLWGLSSLAVRLQQWGALWNDRWWLRRGAVAVLVMLALVIWFSDSARLRAHSDLYLQDLHTWQPERYERVLIIAPHPDDEVLAAGGAIATALAGANPPQIQVAVVTGGDASYSTALLNGYNPSSRRSFQRMGADRQRESLEALISLGLSADQVHFWGFPDHGIEPIWQRYWMGDRAYRSPTTGLTASVQAGDAAVPYTGAGLLGLVRRLLADFQPDVVVMPHPDDAHADHRAMANFISLAVALNQAQGVASAPDLFAYPMWLRSNPRPLSVRLDQDPLRLSARFAVNSGPWLRLPLNDEVAQQKVNALQFYRSQKRSLRSLLHSSARGANEVFAHILQYEVPRYAQLPSPSRPEEWQTFPYVEAQQWIRIPSPVATPLAIWSAADHTDLWLVARLARVPGKGATYTFVVRTVDGQDPVEMRVTADHLVKTDQGVLALAQLSLHHIDRDDPGQVFVTSLETRFSGRIVVARSTWQLLYLAGGSQLP